MPPRHGHNRRQLVESDIVNRPDPSDLEIQNSGQQVETLTQQLEQITIYHILVKDQRPVKTFIIHSTTVF